MSLELGLEPLKPELVLENLSGKTALYSKNDKKIHLGSSQKFFPHVVRHELAHYYADDNRMFSGIVTVPMGGFAPLQRESREAEAESHLMGELQAYNRQAIEVLQGLHHGTWKAELPVDKWFVELALLYVKNYKQFMRKILDANSDLVRRTYFGKDPKGEQKVAVICEDLLENLSMSRNPTMKDVLAAELPDVGALEEEFLKQKSKL